MGDEPPDPDDGRDEPDDDRTHPESDDDHWLSSLLSALEALEDGPLSGRRHDGRKTIDYDVSIGSGEDILDGSPFEETPRADRPDDRPRTRRYRSSDTASSQHVTTRQHDDELLVIADVSGSDPDDVTVGFDGSRLVVGLSGRELERVEIPWAKRTAEATINNGVLTVRIQDGADNGRDSDDG